MLPSDDSDHASTSRSSAAYTTAYAPVAGSMRHRRRKLLPSRSVSASSVRPSLAQRTLCQLVGSPTSLRPAGCYVKHQQRHVAVATIIQHCELRRIGAEARYCDDVVALVDALAYAACDILDVDVEMGLVALVGGVDDLRCIWRPCAEVVDRCRIGGQFAWFGVAIEQQQLLALVAAAIDAVDQPIIDRRAADERDLFVVGGELPSAPVARLSAQTWGNPEPRKWNSVSPSREKLGEVAAPMVTKASGSCGMA